MAAEVTEKELKAIFSGDSSSYESAVNRMRRAHEDLLEGERRVKTNLQGLARELFTVGSAQDAVAISALRLSEVFKVGLGAAIGVGVGVTVFEKIRESVKKSREEATKASEEFTKAVRAATFTSASDSTDDLTKKMAALHEQSQAGGKAIEAMNTPLAMAKSGIIDRAASTIDSFFRNRPDGFKQPEQIREAQAGQLNMDIRLVERQMKDLQDKLVKGAEDRYRITRQTIAGEREDAALLSLQVQYEKELAALKSRPGEAPATQAERDAIERTMEAQKASLIAEKDIRYIREQSARRVLEIESSSRSEAAKRYAILKETLAIAEAEQRIRGRAGMDTREAANTELATRTALMRQDQNLNLGKSQLDINERFRQDRQATREEDRFNRIRNQNLGLIPTQRDMGGNVIRGINPITGARESREAPDNLAPSRFQPRLADQLKPSSSEREQRKADDEAFHRQFETAAARKRRQDAEDRQSQQDIDKGNAPKAADPVVQAIKDLGADIKATMLK